MDFFSKIADLQAEIHKFIAIHNNPHDTSKHNDLAKKLTKLESSLKTIASTSAPSKTIQHSVGKGGVNNYKDVLVVQELLGIKVDGDCGVKTNLAIRLFQRRLGFKKTDGLIEPNGITWKNLVKKASPIDDSENNSNDDDTLLTPTSTTLKNSVGKNGVNNLDDVVLVQKLLGLKTNGKCGLKTIKAIRNFQKSLNFKNLDGIIEPNGITWKHLNKSATTDAEKGADSSQLPTRKSTALIQQSVGLGGVNALEDVQAIQKILKENWGYAIPVDGKMDDKTVQAIRKFQYRFAGSIQNQDSRIDVNGNTLKYLVGDLKPTMPKTEDGIIGGAESPLEKKMAEFTKVFTGIQIEVNPGEFVSVRPPYHINIGKRLKRVLAARKANPKVKRVILGLGFGGGVGKATPAQIETFLEKCIAKNLIKDKTSQGLHEFLSTYGVSTDCSGLAVQAANFLLDGDMERPKLSQRGEEVKITNTAGIQQHPKVASPKQLRAGDMMVNYKRKGTSTYHVRIIIDVDEIENSNVLEFTTVESGSSSDLGDGGDGVGQRRWKFPDKTKFENIQILKGNNWIRANASDQAYTYVRMKQLAQLKDE
ncbi:peptidoglycan-binding domain-containing protein [Aureispira anguillae]|uniref:Peptidoglycan-binding protein n=1 Tax=Aureispira anguillae TaxID=2864201 RepID=A0A915YHI2_9BACT|nr:peptidoglycan-binding protein [Aureispira anguillae]BDS13274.1 peptidoglycan-binding protein [Aureispira anguillae]